jgi:hypothetical protein
MVEFCQWRIDRCRRNENIDGLEQQNEQKIEIAKAEIALTGE